MGSTNEVKIFSGSSNPELAQKICDELGLTLGNITISRFADGEIGIAVEETVRGRDVFFIQSTNDPVNDHLMEALIAADAFKRASAHHINLVIPYYGYARQDRKNRGREPITAKLVTDLIETAGVDRVIAVDLHAGQIQGYFDIPLDHLQAKPIISEYFKSIIPENEKEKWAVVSPDLGGVTRARKLADALGLDIAIIEKSRPKPNESQVMNVIGEFKDKNCIIIDDIIDTAGTITNAANALVEKGANKVYISATHGVLSKDAVKKIENSVVEECVITDTIALPESKKSNKIKVLTMSKIIAETIRRVSNYKSVSELLGE
ncbi:MAG: ribose-phosphate pyrophosphokinase [Tissierellia bacterium]|nr:ribose-phosphate pyrophosphokinase [Tissierellia bacterium]